MNRECSPVLLNGCFRSGTTLLDKVLHSHPSIVLASQAYPMLFLYAKERFLKEKGLRRRYSLGHQFLEDSYTPGEFRAFLDTLWLDEHDLSQIFFDLANGGNSVQTREIVQCAPSIVPGYFPDVFVQFSYSLRELFPKEGPVRYIGSKEAFVEEYIPYLLSKDVKVILIVRDPRDVVASTNVSNSAYMGDRRPLLYSLRAWRKSVAYALGCEGDPNFCWIYYESLVRDPPATLHTLTSFLKLDDYPRNAFRKGIYDQRGELWESNSSFKRAVGFDAAALGRFRSRLPAHVISYIEAACYPEMRALGYEHSVLHEFNQEALKRYKDPDDAIHAKFSDEPNYSSISERIERECERFNLLRTKDPNLSETVLRRWFIHPRAYARLRAAIR